MAKQAPLTIECPMTWRYENALNFVNQLEKLPLVEKLRVDFSRLNFSRPFGSLWIAEGIKDLVEKRRTQGLETDFSGTDQVNDAQSFLRHIGFFEYCGIGLGKNVGEAGISNNCIPIREIRMEQFGWYTFNLFDRIDSYAAELTRMVMGLDPTVPLPDHPVRYCFTEIIRNVFEHSTSRRCVLSAQRYRGNELEIAILDRGIGIKNSLSGKFPVENDKQAIDLALMPGISCADLNDETAINQGFGLYVISEIGKRTGSFSISSGNNSFFVSRSGSRDIAINFGGTAICLVATKPRGENPIEFVKKIISEGEQIAYEAGRVRVPTGAVD